MDQKVQARRLDWLGVLALVALVAAQATAIVMSPPDRDMGHLEKILYVHVPVAQNAFLAYFVVAVASLLYLWRGAARYDLIAAAAAEVGAVFTALTLLLGSIWARPTWGIWWTWDARLTTTAVLLLIFVGYLALRSFVEDFERRAQWSAVVGIIGALNVPIVYMSVRWWRTLHQTQSLPSTMAPRYVTGMRMNDVAVLLVLAYFIAKRYQAARTEYASEELLEQAALRGG